MEADVYEIILMIMTKIDIIHKLQFLNNQS